MNGPDQEDLQFRESEIKRILFDIRRGDGQKNSEAVPFFLSEKKSETDYSLAELQGELEELMRTVYTACVTMPADPVPSPRAFIGKPITWAKKLFLKLTRPFSSMLLQPQIDFNENLVEELKVMNRLLNHALGDILKLYAEFSTFRLRSAEIEAENSLLKQQAEISERGNNKINGLRAS